MIKISRDRLTTPFLQNSIKFNHVFSWNIMSKLILIFQLFPMWSNKNTLIIIICFYNNSFSNWIRSISCVTCTTRRFTRLCSTRVVNSCQRHYTHLYVSIKSRLYLHLIIEMLCISIHLDVLPEGIVVEQL